MEAHGCKITVESTAGRSTTFAITFPIEFKLAKESEKTYSEQKVAGFIEIRIRELEKMSKQNTANSIVHTFFGKPKKKSNGNFIQSFLL